MRMIVHLFQILFSRICWQVVILAGEIYDVFQEILNATVDPYMKTQNRNQIPFRSFQFIRVE